MNKNNKKCITKNYSSGDKLLHKLLSYADT